MDDDCRHGIWYANIRRVDKQSYMSYLLLRLILSFATVIFIMYL